jgi:XTP/dITP diphosphohydrolase
MLTIVLATHNPGKLKEMREITTGWPVRWQSLEDYSSIGPVAETGDTFAANARLKAIGYAAQTGHWTLADDSGLEVDALDGAPGVHSARYAGEPKDDGANNRKLLAALAEVPAELRTARFRCAMALVRGDEILVETTGTFEGVIIDEPRGANGFGYDPLFLVPDLGKTSAELPAEVKNARSHRGQALQALLGELEGMLAGPASDGAT